MADESRYTEGPAPIRDISSAVVDKLRALRDKPGRPHDVVRRNADAIRRKVTENTMKSHSLSRRERLIRERDFDATYREHRFVRDERLVLCFRANSLAHSRIGSSVSGRWGNSVHRNRFRRYCREAFRLHKADLPKGFDMIIIPRKGIDMSLDELSASLLALAGKVVVR